MRAFLVDSSVLVALFDKGDSLAANAQSLWQALYGQQIYFLDCVINEVISVLCKRFEERKRLADWPGVYQQVRDFFSKDKVVWAYQEVERMYNQILDMIGEHGGRLNFHDALICLLAREQGVTHIVSFDPDFDAINWLTRIATAEVVPKKEKTQEPI